jgi:hypothetical protein
LADGDREMGRLLPSPPTANGLECCPSLLNTSELIDVDLDCLRLSTDPVLCVSAVCSSSLGAMYRKVNTIVVPGHLEKQDNGQVKYTIV